MNKTTANFRWNCPIRFGDEETVDDKSLSFEPSCFCFDFLIPYCPNLIQSSLHQVIDYCFNCASAASYFLGFWRPQRNSQAVALYQEIHLSRDALVLSAQVHFEQIDFWWGNLSHASSSCQWLDRPIFDKDWHPKPKWEANWRSNRWCA